MKLHYIKNLKDKYLDETIELYIRAFPKDERFPIPDLVELILKGKADCTVLLDSETFAGASYQVFDKETVYILFLAIDDRIRSKGYGTSFLKVIKESYDNRRIALLIESLSIRDAANFSERKKRESFYIKNGFQYGELSFKEPGGIFDLMINGEPISKENMSRFFYDVIGEALLNKWNAEIIKPQWENRKEE